MNKIKTQFLIFFFILIANSTQAQIFDFYDKWNKKRIDKRNENYATEHVYSQKLYGMGLQFYQNQNFAANKYFGLGFAIDNSKLVDRKKYYRIFDNNVKFGGLFITESISPTGSFNTRLAFSRLNKKGKTLAIGGQLAANMNFRINSLYQNNALSFDANLDLGPRVRYEDTFKVFYSKIKVEYNLAVPIVSYGIYGPGYSTSFGNNTAGVFLPNKYQRIQSGLFFTLGTNKRYPNKSVKIGYQWDYMHQDLGNNLNLYNALHTISFIGNINKLK